MDPAKDLRDDGEWVISRLGSSGSVIISLERVQISVFLYFLVNLSDRGISYTLGCLAKNSFCKLFFLGIR